jgi:hypothetical protein
MKRNGKSNKTTLMFECRDFIDPIEKWIIIL